MEINHTTFIQVISIPSISKENIVTVARNTKICGTEKSPRKNQVSSKKQGTNLNDILLYILISLTNFSFVFLLSPFRFVLQRSVIGKEKVKRVGWILQQLACVLLIFPGFLWQFNVIWKSIPGKLKVHSPSAYFSALLPAMRLCFTSFSTLNFWLSQSDFTKLANFLNVDYVRLNLDRNQEKIMILLKWVTRFLYVMAGVLGLYTFGVEVGFIFREDWKSRLLESSYQSVFLSIGNDSSRNNISIEETTLSQTDSLVGVFGGIGAWHWSISWISCHLVLFVFVMILWLATNSFISALQTDLKAEENDALETKLITMFSAEQWIHTVDPKQKGDHIDWEKAFRSLQELSCLINKIIQNSFSLYILQLILFYSTLFIQIEEAQESDQTIIDYITILIEASFSMIILRFSADIPHELKWIKVWYMLAASNGTTGSISSGQLQVIFDDINRGTVGVKCSGICTITFGQIANVAGMSATFFVIGLQAHALMKNGYLPTS